MRSVERFEVICPFCGCTLIKTRTIEDGVDWEGHHRGSYSCDEKVERCSFFFGKMAGKDISIREMCVNCKYYNGGCCNNTKRLSGIRNSISNFDIPLNKVIVKNPKLSCNCHELDYTIFSSLFLKEG